MPRLRLVVVAADDTSRLFGVTAMPVNRGRRDVRPLLEARGHGITTSTVRLREL